MSLWVVKVSARDNKDGTIAVEASFPNLGHSVELSYRMGSVEEAEKAVTFFNNPLDGQGIAATLCSIRDMQRFLGAVQIDGDLIEFVLALATGHEEEQVVPCGKPTLTLVASE